MKRIIPTFPMLRLLACLGLLLALCMTTGCPKTPVSQPVGSPDPVVAGEGTVQNELVRARRMLDAGQPGEAEKVYSLLSMRTDLSDAQRIECFQGFALAATRNKHAFVAMGALENWRSYEPGADATPAWLNLWKSNLAALPRAEGRKHAQSLFGDTSRPWPVRASATAYYAVSLAENGKDAEALSTLTTAAREANTGEKLALFEEALLDNLARLSVPPMQRLSAQISPANEEQFPYRVIALEHARRMLATNARALPAIEMLERFSRSRPFANEKLLGLVLAQAIAEPAATGAREVALILPLTGPYADIGWKIVQGVNAAQWETAAGGTELVVHVINTETPDWTARLMGLPANCRIVGGPLRTSVYNQGKASGALRGRVPFTFTQRLDAGDEGRLAWRFFANPADQIRALLDFAQSMGAANYGILRPDDAYGTRMADEFSKAVYSRGLAMQKEAVYPLGQHEEWTKIVRTYVSATMKGRDPIPSAQFEATFMPDGWLNSEMLVPNLFFYNEEKQILLATNLWEQELTERAKIDARNFSLAVFPSAWDPTLTAPAAANLNLLLADAGLPAPDYWSSLGYDFVRFAMHLNLPPDGSLSADDMNRRLATVDGFAWSGAPISWNNGVAAQRLGMFTPTENGYEPVDPEQYKRRLDRARQRQAQRIRLIRNN